MFILLFVFSNATFYDKDVQCRRQLDNWGGGGGGGESNIYLFVFTDHRTLINEYCPPNLEQATTLKIHTTWLNTPEIFIGNLCN